MQPNKNKHKIHPNNRISSRGDSDRFIFILSLIASVIFWLLIKLSDNYSQNYTMLLKYKHVPVDKQLTKLVDSTLTVNISANGYNIFVNQIKGKLNIFTINLDKCKIIREKNNVYFINENNIKNILSDYLEIPETNININKRKLRFILEKTAKKTIKVKAVTDFKFKSQFGLYGLNVIPSSVIAYGPSSVLDTLKVVLTNLLTTTNLDKDVILNVALKNPSPLLHFVPQKVKVKIDVEKYTEAFMNVPINVSGIIKDMRTFPSTTKVYYHVAIKDYNSVHPHMFDVEPDIKGVNLNEVSKIKLKIVRKPNIVSRVRLDPSEVEFLIVK